MRGNQFERFDHEVERFSARQAVNAGTPEFGFGFTAHSADKGLRKDHSVLNQVRHVENQRAAPRFSVQHGQAMRQAKHPARAGSQAVGQVVAMIEKSIG